MIEPDDQLVRRTRAGDREAFSALVQRYERPVQAVAWNVLRNWHDANDVSQQAFVQAYEKLNRLWFARKFGSWLLCITHRLALRRLQQRRRRSCTQLDAGIVAPAPRPELSDLSIDLMVLLGRLPAHERLVVSLRHLDGLTLIEVAQVTGRPVSTVSKQLSRAYVRLRGWLNGTASPEKDAVSATPDRKRGGAVASPEHERGGEVASPERDLSGLSLSEAGSEGLSEVTHG